MVCGGGGGGVMMLLLSYQECVVVDKGSDVLVRSVVYGCSVLLVRLCT